MQNRLVSRVAENWEGRDLERYIGNLYPAELVWLIQSIAIQSMQPAVLSRLLRLSVDCKKTVAVTETVAGFPDGHNIIVGFCTLFPTVHITLCQAYGGECICMFANWPWHLQQLQVHKNMQQSLQRGLQRGRGRGNPGCTAVVHREQS